MPNQKFSQDHQGRADLRNVINYYRKKALHYDEDYSEWYWKLYNDLTWNFLKPYLPHNNTARVLDVGAGTGKWAIKLAKMGFHVDCIDISPEMLKIAKEKVKIFDLTSNITFQIKDIRDLSYLSDNSYDLVLALGDVISYCIDDSLAVKELYRVTKHDGWCIASLDSKFIYMLNHIKYNQFKVLKSVEQTGISYFFKNHPVKVYTPQELQNLFQNAGFNVNEICGKSIFSGALRRKMREKKISENYELFLQLEMKYGRDPSFIGQAGHLQISAQKS
ncbi:class I SAM-dependent methyltransferase [Candidatus Harpocratesius sp.]